MAALNFWATAAYLFIVYSRLPEYLPPRIAIVSFGLACFTAVAAGRIHKLLATRLGALVVVFTCLMLASTPLSLWPGGSAGVLKDVWLRSFLLFFLIAGAASTPKRTVGLILTVPMGVTFAAVMALIFGATNVEGRLAGGAGRFANPNTFAIALVISMTLWMVVVSDRSRSLIFRALGLGCLCVLFFALAKTVSRGAMVAVLVVGVFLLWRLPLASKIRVVLAASLLIPISLAFLPGELLGRFTTFTSSGRTTTLSERATSSAEARLHVLMQAGQVAMRYPILGAGPGMFQVAEYQLSQDEGSRASWSEAHNTFASAAAECGIPALFVYLGIIYTAWTLLTSAEKKALAAGPPVRRYAPMALYLRAAILAFCVTGFFGNSTYRDYLPLLCGLSIGLHQAVLTEVRAAERRRGLREETPDSAPPSLPVPRPA